MAFTQAQLFALESAMAQGVVLKEYPDGTKTQFRSFDEMVKTYDFIRRKLGVITKSSTRKKAQFSRGLTP